MVNTVSLEQKVTEIAEVRETGGYGLWEAAHGGKGTPWRFRFGQIRARLGKVRLCPETSSWVAFGDGDEQGAAGHQKC
jgi:hypothetical protein